MTTEKELDTVEVLKAIQKAKEVKSKLSNPEKKVGLCVGGVAVQSQLKRERAGSQWNWAVGVFRAVDFWLHDLGQVTPPLFPSIRWER